MELVPGPRTAYFRPRWSRWIHALGGFRGEASVGMTSFDGIRLPMADISAGSTHSGVKSDESQRVSLGHILHSFSFQLKLRQVPASPRVDNAPRRHARLSPCVLSSLQACFSHCVRCGYIRACVHCCAVQHHRRGYHHDHEALSSTHLAWLVASYARSGTPEHSDSRNKSFYFNWLPSDHRGRNRFRIYSSLLPNSVASTGLRKCCRAILLFVLADIRSGALICHIYLHRSRVRRACIDLPVDRYGASPLVGQSCRIG